mmetsp:Transcript_26692/g.48947  ORF Transcript_26692/g.48947 Transcript_26692/m.48947 type:complete len:243 (+) Transcript_26692:79-807(+)
MIQVTSSGPAPCAGCFALLAWGALCIACCASAEEHKVSNRGSATESIRARVQAASTSQHQCEKATCSVNCAQLGCHWSVGGQCISLEVATCQDYNRTACENLNQCVWSAGHVLCQAVSPIASMAEVDEDVVQEHDRWHGGVSGHLPSTMHWAEVNGHGYSPRTAIAAQEYRHGDLPPAVDVCQHVTLPDCLSETRAVCLFTVYDACIPLNEARCADYASGPCEILDQCAWNGTVCKDYSMMS